MSSRARYETKSGESLVISRGSLRIRNGESGETAEHSISGEVAFDPKSRQLTVPVLVVNIEKHTMVRTVSRSTIIFEITKDPGQLRKATRSRFVEVEKGRLLNALRSLPQSLGADPSGMGGSTNPAYEKAKANLNAFCTRYGLDPVKVMNREPEKKAEKKAEPKTEAPKVESAPKVEAVEAAPAAAPEKPRKKAKERRAEAKSSN